MSRRDVLIEKLADCMDRDNAEALVNDVILDEVSTLRAALLQSQAELYNHVACMVTEDSLRERAEVAEEALLQSQEVQGWQPIETASKDADLLLLYDEGDGVQSGYWHDDANYTGWVCVETQGLTGGRMRPIHWMPLPSPPVAPKER